MNSVLSLVSGQFSKSLILGAFFPVVLFLVLGVVAVAPLLPSGVPALEVFQSLDAKWELLALTFVAIVLTVFLYNLNTPIVRLFEGYPWRLSTLGQARTRHYLRRFEEVKTGIPRIRMIIAARKAIDPADPVVNDLQTRLDQFGRRRIAEYPSEGGFVLPTRFGNVVRAFEGYPRTQYGMDGVTFWPRLVSVVPKDALDPADAARSSVDFFINSSVLSALLTAVLFVVGCLATNPKTPVSTMIRWPLETVAAAICAFLFYNGAISQAAAWGAEVKSLFDLYRWDLLKKLGYQQLPENRVDERAVWAAIGKQFQFGDPASRPPLPYKKPEAAAVSTSVSADPADLGTELSCGIESGWWRRGRYVYQVRNVDLAGRSARSLKLTVVLPNGVAYVWTSATLNGRPCRVTGMNPLLFDVGPLPVDGTAEVTLQALRSA
jgi:hypothetical protein